MTDYNIFSEDKKILIIGGSGSWKTTFVSSCGLELGSNHISHDVKDGTQQLFYYKFGDICLVDTPGINSETLYDLSNILTSIDKLLGILWFIPFNSIRDSMRKMERTVLNHIVSCHKLKIQTIIVWTQGEPYESLVSYDSFKQTIYSNRNKPDSVIVKVKELMKNEPSDPVNSWELYNQINGLKKTESVLNDKCSKLESDLITSGEKIKAANSRVTELEIETKQLMGNITELKQTVSTQNTTINNAGSDLKISENKLREALSELKTMVDIKGKLSGVSSNMSSLSLGVKMIKEQIMKTENDTNCFGSIKQSHINTIKDYLNQLETVKDQLNNIIK